MKIREQRANYSESESGIDKDAGLTLATADPSRFERSVFQSAHDGCTDGDDSTFLVERATDRVRGVRANAVALDVQFVGFNALLAQRLKRSQSDMERDLYDLDSVSQNLIEDLWCEVKSGSRRCSRSAIASEDSLIALAISRFIVTADIWRKRNVANTLDSLEEVRH